jgi:glycosyltransferase involved in cell wall biosynthesis
LFEPSGYAGVFQHACRVSQLLHGGNFRITLHTGHQHEPVETERVDLCACSWWPRDERRGVLRSTRIAVRLAARTLPHLHRTCPPESILHVQGIAAGGALTLLALAVGRLRNRHVVYSPHDTFSRRGPLDGVLLRVALRVPHAVIAHSEADVVALRARGIPAYYSPLVQLVPVPAESQRRHWRNHWRAADDTAVVLFAGCIRPEKRLDLLIESARSWPSGRKLAVVGEDRGGWDYCAQLARRRGVDVVARVEFIDLDDFAAAISAADLVVAPHEKASQSGVLSLARQLGVATVAANVGGLAELASRTFRPGHVDDLTRAIDAQLTESDATPPPVDERLAVRAHLRAYGEPLST